jgi:hypothetical protein
LSNEKNGAFFGGRNWLQVFKYNKLTFRHLHIALHN